MLGRRAELRLHRKVLLPLRGLVELARQLPRQREFLCTLCSIHLTFVDDDNNFVEDDSRRNWGSVVAVWRYIHRRRPNRSVQMAMQPEQQMPIAGTGWLRGNSSRSGIRCCRARIVGTTKDGCCYCNKHTRYSSGSWIKEIKISRK